jgi:hypothetical protein
MPSFGMSKNHSKCQTERLFIYLSEEKDDEKQLANEICLGILKVELNFKSQKYSN